MSEEESKSRSDRPKRSFGGDRSRTTRGDRPSRGGSRDGASRPFSRGGSRDDRPRSDRPRDGAPRSDRPSRDGSRDDRPRNDRPRGDRDSSSSRGGDRGGFGGRPSSSRGGSRDGSSRPFSRGGDRGGRSFDRSKSRPQRSDDRRFNHSDNETAETTVTENTEEKTFSKENFKRKKVFEVNDMPKKRSFFKDKDDASLTKAKLRVGGRLEIAVANLSANLNVLISAAHRAGRGLAYDFNELSGLTVNKKSDNSLVSEADIKAEAAVVSTLNKARPDFGYLLEEGGKKEGSDKTKTFIVDPLDGTSNFLHGIPHFAVSIAMVVDNEIVAGVIYNPISDETFYAEKGTGAYILNGGTNRRIRVSNNTKFIDCIITTGIPNAKTPDHKEYIVKLSKVMAEVDGIRRTGSAALDLAYVAAGRFDGYFEKGIKPWDIAAGILIVKEAGGTVLNYDGEEKDSLLLEKDSIIASNDGIKNNFKKILL